MFVPLLYILVVISIKKKVNTECAEPKKSVKVTIPKTGGYTKYPTELKAK